jgi:hypothetical protein
VVNGGKLMTSRLRDLQIHPVNSENPVILSSFSQKGTVLTSIATHIRKFIRSEREVSFTGSPNRSNDESFNRLQKLAFGSDLNYFSFAAKD